ncbi:hypothetical protein GN956_G9983 [Arapaima gigas]
MTVPFIAIVRKRELPHSDIHFWTTKTRHPNDCRSLGLTGVEVLSQSFQIFKLRLRDAKEGDRLVPAVDTQQLELSQLKVFLALSCLL